MLSRRKDIPNVSGQSKSFDEMDDDDVDDVDDVDESFE